MKTPLTTKIAIAIMIGTAIGPLQWSLPLLLWSHTYASVGSFLWAVISNLYPIGVIVIALSLAKIPTRRWSKKLSMIILVLQICWNYVCILMLPVLLADLGRLLGEAYAGRDAWFAEPMIVKQWIIKNTIWVLVNTICFLMVRRLKVQAPASGADLHPAMAISN